MKEKEEIKRVDGRYYLIRELEPDGEPIPYQNGMMMQPIKSIDDDDCLHCCLYDTYSCGDWDHCTRGFFVWVLPENSKETKPPYEELEHYYNSTVGLWAMDRNPHGVGLTWIRKNAFQLSLGENLPNERRGKEKTTVEWKIGEIKQIDGEWYQCVEGGDCADCAFIDYCKSHSKEERDSAIGLCVPFDRSDEKHIVFQKLEKFGECYGNNGKIYQLHRLPLRVEQPLPHPEEFIFVKPDVVQIEIKQTKEDMGKEKHLKPFDLEAAKAGKPVCTRDGRKARIVCFDRKGDMSITALITNKDIDNDNKVSETEEVHFYYENGRCNEYQEYRYDLMMLPEKKEGWVNVYKDYMIHLKVRKLI